MVKWPLLLVNNSKKLPKAETCEAQRKKAVSRLNKKAQG